MARDIDKDLGILSGEAAGQRSERQVALRAQSFPYVPSRQSRDDPSYYGHPTLKEPTWIWSIPTYFYVGGVAGVGTALGTAAQLFAPHSMRSLVTRSRWVGTVGGAVSAALLIHDLGRPERFLHMLRVFRLSSPMSMGSWILSGFSACVSGAAMLPLGPRFLAPLCEPLGFLAGVFGLGLSGYTGVLISQTAVPVWQASYRITPFLFLASGMASAAALFEFFPHNRQETMAIERFGLIGKIAELLAALALERNAGRVERVGRPLRNGFSGLLWQTAKVLTVGGIVVALIPSQNRKKRICSGVLGTAASLCLRFGVFYAGRVSARDPHASFEQQRAGAKPGS